MELEEIMTIEEAIEHAEEVAQEKRYDYQECLAVHDIEEAIDCRKCGEEHEQLAAWLKELLKYKSQSEIVHCKDCKYNLLNRKGFKPDALDIVCDYFGIVNLKENDYCSRGVRVDDEQEI